MYRGSGTGCCPDKWQTKEVLKWMQENDDSKDEIKNRVMGVVQANDLDGHTLKQLVAEKDEIQNLFPALKDRLAFKSMLRHLFNKEESKVLPVDTTNNTPKQTPPVPVAAYPHKLVSSFPSPNDLRFPAATSTTLPREGLVPSTHHPRQVHAVDVHVPHQRAVEHQRKVQENQTLSSSTMSTNSVLPQKMRDLINVENSFSVPSAAHFSMKQNIQPPKSTHHTIYYSHSSPPPTTLRQALQSETSSSSVSPTITSSITPSATPVHLLASPSATQPLNPVHLLPSAADALQPLPQISSITSYGLLDEITAKTPNPRSVTSSNNNSPSKFYRKHNSSAGFYRYIDYPAPVPDFPDDILEWINSKEAIRPSVRKRIMRDCGQFYVTISMGQRLNSNDYANIGRTLIEKFPALACSGPIPWALFNKSLSQCIRNLRRRLKKVGGGCMSLAILGDAPSSSQSAVAFDTNEISDDDTEEVEEVTCIEVDEGDEEEEEEQDVFFIKEELPAWNDEQGQ